MTSIHRLTLMAVAFRVLERLFRHAWLSVTRMGLPLCVDG